MSLIDTTKADYNQEMVDKLMNWCAPYGFLETWDIMLKALLQGKMPCIQKKAETSG